MHSVECDPWHSLPCYEVEVIRCTVQVLVLQAILYRLRRCCLLIEHRRSLLASVFRVSLCVVSRTVACWSILTDSLFCWHWRNRSSQSTSSLLLSPRSLRRCYCN